MPKLKVKDIQGMNDKDREAKLAELQKELIKLNAQVATGTVPKSPGELRNVKKNIARILTLSHKKGGKTQ